MIDELIPTDVQEVPVVAEQPYTTLQKSSGVLALLVLFIAGANLSAAYFADLQSQGTPQTAAAFVPVDEFARISLEGKAAFVLDLTTGKTLYALHPDVQLPLASLTKVPLALVASEVLLPDTIITIPIHDTPDGAAVRLPAGLRFGAQDIIDFTLVGSSNEGAEVLASASRAGISRKYPEAEQGREVLWRMNDLAGNLGLTHTYFLNANGLDLSTTQAGAYGSARDMARLFGYAALVSPHTFEQTAKAGMTIRALSGETVSVVNTDEVLPAIPGLIMGKTGYTDLAGGNLAIVFEIGPARPIAAVILHSSAQGRFSDMKKLVTATQRVIAAQ